MAYEQAVRYGVAVAAFALLAYAFFIGVQFIIKGITDIGYAIVTTSISLFAYLTKDVFGSSRDKIEIAAPGGYKIHVQATIYENNIAIEKR